MRAQDDVIVEAGGEFDVHGAVTIYYNPTNTTYTPTTFTNSDSAGSVSAFMYVNSAADLQTLSNTSSTWGNNFLEH